MRRALSLPLRFSRAPWLSSSKLIGGDADDVWVPAGEGCGDVLLIPACSWRALLFNRGATIL